MCPCLESCSKSIPPTGPDSGPNKTDGGTCADGGSPPCPCDTPEVLVSDVTFQGVTQIYYARIPTAGGGSFLLPAPADAAPVHKHFTPVESRPASGTPHWKKKPGATQDPEFSWPAVYVRTGGGSAPKLKASFELQPVTCPSATVKIKATSSQGVNIAEKTLTFAGGKASDTFDLQNLPSTVKRLDGIEFTWTFEINSSIRSSRVTKHTLFVVDQPPKKANLHPAREDKFLWEILDWSCKWTDGVTGHQNVLAGIWAKFSPVTSAHDTSLVYWKNWQPPLSVPPNQDLPSAIQSQDDPDTNKQNAASCIVFDEVLMTCLAAHGIASAEVTLRPPSGTFTRAGHTYTCSGWNDTTTVGQGNTSAPPSWASHWIAVVSVPVAPSWKFYDASYGPSPVDSVPPSSAGSTIDIHTYEPLTAASFDCQQAIISSGGVSWTQVTLSRDPSSSVPPHLLGVILWTNR